MWLKVPWNGTGNTKPNGSEMTSIRRFFFSNRFQSRTVDQSHLLSNWSFSFWRSTWSFLDRHPNFFCYVFFTAIRFQFRTTFVINQILLHSFFLLFDHPIFNICSSPFYAFLLLKIYHYRHNSIWCIDCCFTIISVFALFYRPYRFNVISAQWRHNSSI